MRGLLCSWQCCSYPGKDNLTYSAERVLERHLLDWKMKIYKDPWFNQFKDLSKVTVQYLVHATLCSLFFPNHILLLPDRAEAVCLPPPRAGHGFPRTLTSCLVGQEIKLEIIQEIKAFQTKITQTKHFENNSFSIISASFALLWSQFLG